MFDHKNLATDGLYPGLFSTWSAAVLGTFEIEVVIEPVVPQFGGGGYVPHAPIDKYRVRIKVTHKGKVWNYEKTISRFFARVWARLLKIKLKEPTVVVHDPLLSSYKQEVTIKVEKR